jgi:hypothetical protein
MWFNPLIKAVLGSPMHPLLSRNTMVITFSGRVSGRAYSFPVNYHSQGDLITVFTPRQRSWWKNFRQPIPVRLQVQGEPLEGTGCRVAASPAQVREAAQAAYPGLPASRLERMGQEMEMIQIRLEMN